MNEILTPTDNSKQIRNLTRSDRKYLELLENTDDIVTIDMIMKHCKMSKSTAFRVRKRLEENVVTVSKRVAKTQSVDMIRYLNRNASNGDTGAAVKILEIGGVYTPKQIGGAQGTVNLGIIVLPTREVLPGEPVEVEVVEAENLLKP